MNLPGRPSSSPQHEPFVADLSEGAETGVYLALLELIDEGLLIIGDELILDANTAACKLLERDYREIAGQPLASLFPNEEGFLEARGRLLIQGERRSQVGFALPDGRTRELKVLCAPRLRPGVHALVLSPTGSRARASSRPASRTTAPPTVHFAAHLDPEHRLLSRPGSLFDTTIWPDASAGSFEPRLWQALDQDEFTLNFQPLIDTRSKRLCAGEALLRWQHPTLGQLPFGRFRNAIHDPQLIARLGDWALNAACRSARTWQNGKGRKARLTVNVATEQLLHGDFAECVRLVLEDNDLPPERLELDLDEKVLESESPGLLSALKALSAMGVRLAIDDFGRGLSSIPRLRRYPLNAVKLTPGLVQGVGHSEDSEAVVEAIVSLAGTLGLEVFARGVETPAQRDFLSALACHLQQGPLFGQPMTAHEFSRFSA